MSCILSCLKTADTYLVFDNHHGKNVPLLQKTRSSFLLSHVNICPKIIIHGHTMEGVISHRSRTNTNRGMPWETRCLHYAWRQEYFNCSSKCWCGRGKSKKRRLANWKTYDLIKQVSKSSNLLIGWHCVCLRCLTFRFDEKLKGVEILCFITD